MNHTVTTSDRRPQAWQLTFRKGIAPALSTAGLEALRRALLDDSAQLVQGATTQPPPLQAVETWPCEAGCALALACWKGLGLVTVGEVELAFALACCQADERLGEPAGCRWFLNWYDDTPRDEMRRALLAEVNAVLAERAGLGSATAA
jgi:hypothetical protein